MIAMRAAVEGISLTKLEVTIDSDSLRVRVLVRAASDASQDRFRKVVDWAERHSPVGDATRRSIPTTLTIERS